MAQPKAKLYPGDKHKDAVRAVNPTMLLSDWLQANYKHVTFETRIAKGGTSLVVPDCNVNLTFALISTDNIQQFARLALHEAPVGTIFDKIPLEWYTDKLEEVKLLLTRKLLLEPDNKMALRYMSVLERRDSDRWGKPQKSVSVHAATGGEDGEANKKVTFDFEIVQ